MRITSICIALCMGFSFTQGYQNAVCRACRMADETGRECPTGIRLAVADGKWATLSDQ
jgi:hypothetical protein